MILSDRLKDYHIILASQSPRRKALLEGLDIDFEVMIKEEIDENYPAGLGMTEIPEFLANAKSEHYIHMLDDHTILITADTIVWHDNQVVGKPGDVEEACTILAALSGSMHEVVTGVCLRSASQKRIFHTHSKVFFKKLLDEEIDYYVRNYLPMDKAGAYGIQEWIGYIGIEKIEGSFYNVMGLPVKTLYQEMTAFVLNHAGRNT